MESKSIHQEPWNKGKIVGQKLPLKQIEVWALRVRLQLAKRRRDLVLFNLAIDSKLRACDLIGLRLKDIGHRERIAARATVMQRKTRRPVQFEITEGTLTAFSDRIQESGIGEADYLFPSRCRQSRHLSTRQYGRIVHGWVRELGPDSAAYGTHTMGPTKASLIYRRNKNLRAVQLLLGHTKPESTVRYLVIEVDDALEMAEQTEV
jgi:integrase